MTLYKRWVSTVSFLDKWFSSESGSAAEQLLYTTTTAFHPQHVSSEIPNTVQQTHSSSVSVPSETNSGLIGTYEWPTALRLGGTSGRRLKIHLNKGLSTRRSNKPFELCLAFLTVCCSVGRGWAKPQELTSCLPCCASLLCNETERLGAPLNTDFKFRFRALGSSQPKPSRKTKHPAAVHQVTV